LTTGGQITFADHAIEVVDVLDVWPAQSGSNGESGEIGARTLSGSGNGGGLLLTGRGSCDSWAWSTGKVYDRKLQPIVANRFVLRFDIR
jgi:hypothetical protein